MYNIYYVENIFISLLFFLHTTVLYILLKFWCIYMYLFKSIFIITLFKTTLVHYFDNIYLM